MDDTHSGYMRQALALASRNLGQTWPNPAVGAVIVKDGRMIGEGWTARGGRPHAETQALKNCNARDTTLYVTFEPCAHYGQTPPCTQAIIDAGIKTVVVACRDPHKEVNGQGIAQLKAAGIEVILGIGENEARKLNRGFISVVEQNRPYVAMKIATSKDGKIAYAPSHAIAFQREGGWITGEEARAEVHRLRSQFDAVVTGIGTVLADDPLLTVRLPGLEDKSPVRVVLDRNHRLPADSKIAKTSGLIPTWILDLPDIPAVLKHLTQKGITRVLVEAGQKLNTAFLQSGAVDRLYWFKAPAIIGEGGLAAVEGELAELLTGWTKTADTLSFGADTLEIFERI